MPKKKNTSENAKATRARSRERGKARKAERVAAQAKRAEENRLGGKLPRRRVRPRQMRTCLRCQQRQIVAGSVCWCRSIGADIESLRSRR